MTEQVADPNANAAKIEVALDKDGNIPGTTYKTVEDMVKGHSNLKDTLDRQGTELGTIRKDHDSLKGQAETMANLLKEQLTGGKKVEPVVPVIDYDAQLAAVEKEIQGLDPVKENYQTALASLVTKSNRITAAKQHQMTLDAAGKLMQKELTDRDVKASRLAFMDANPEFNTPEMQAKIQEYIAKDKTGMSDPLSAFREIQRDEALAAKTTLEAENAEMKRLLDLAKGKNEAGKVVVKPQGTGNQTKPTKVTGKDLDAGMMSALHAASA